MSAHTLISLAAAADMDPAVWEDLSACELDADPSTLNRTAHVWLWLCGVDAGSPDADRVGGEVLSDGGLIVALNLPAVEFLRWFRGAEWAHFDSTLRTGGEAWAWAVLQRAWAACEALGELARQCALRAPA